MVLLDVVTVLAQLRDLLLQRNRLATTMKFLSLLEWQLSEALQQILRSPTALAVLLVEHAYSSLFFDSILARHVAGARRNGPTRFGVWFAAPSRYTPPVSHRTPYHRRSQRRRHKPPPFCKVLFPFHWVCCLPVPQFLC